MYKRKKREADGSTSEYAVEDHAWRLYRDGGGDVNALPDYFVSALAMSAQDHRHDGSRAALRGHVAISKTVNIPADHPNEDFRPVPQVGARSKAWPPTGPTPSGSVLEVSTPAPAPPAAAAPAPAPAAPVVDPMRTVIESRPSSGLSAVAEKVEYWTQEGHKTLYIIVSFPPVPTGVGNHVHRAIEFFMPVGRVASRSSGSPPACGLSPQRGGFSERAFRTCARWRGTAAPGAWARTSALMAPWRPCGNDLEVAAIALPCKTFWPAAWPSRSSNPCRWTSLKRPLACRPRWQARSAVNAARTP